MSDGLQRGLLHLFADDRMREQIRRERGEFDARLLDTSQSLLDGSGGLLRQYFREGWGGQ